MKKHYLITIASLFLAGTVMAEKPEWAGSGKPTAEQKAAHKAAMQGKQGANKNKAEAKEKLKDKKEKTEKAAGKEKNDREPKGLEKQKDKKSDQVQKELGKGSKKGQEASSGKQKWWKFWE